MVDKLDQDGIFKTSAAVDNVGSVQGTRKVLISGGAGFIGSRLASTLTSRGYRVTVLDNLAPQIHGEDGPGSSNAGHYSFIKGDVRSREDWLRALENQNIVVHFAAETGTGQSMYKIERYVDVNVHGTANLLDILANEPHSIEKMLVASSRAIYGEGKYHCPEHHDVYPSARCTADMQAGDFAIKCPICGRETRLLPTDEDSKLHASSVYGISKQSQEQLFMTVGQSLQIPAVALRYQNVYGPGQSLLNPYTGILSVFSTRIRTRAPVYIFEDGKEGRDFVFIDDVIEATRLAIENDASNFEIFNVGSGVRTDILTVAHMLRSALGGTCAIEVTGKFRVGDVRDNLADISKIRSRLGFVPKIEFAEGIRRFADWVSTQKVPKDLFEDSMDEMRRRGLYK
jgi:dTDP-L-rhamnose 4-epimerase